MNAPENLFKKALARRKPLLGLWLALAEPYCAELAATCGFDWLLIDAEHGPNDLRSVLAQLQAVAPHPSHPVVRLPVGDAALIKQYLDIGAQTLLIPMVESAQQARDLVAATRYPPAGIRGVGAALARASSFASRSNYLHTANDEICLLVQVESAEAMKHIDEISGVEGVDGVFIGPSDLAASMGYLGNPQHEAVQAAVADGRRRIEAAGKASGILIGSEALSRRYIEEGFTFVAIGTDVGTFTAGLRALVGRFRDIAPKA